MRPAEPDLEDDLRSEYDFSGAVQGKHYQAYRRGTNVVFLDPDIAKIFTSSEAVNQALRVLLDLERQQAEKRSA
ncbi:MAG TPA: hypothetical protein VN783_17615 [Thermoanaerobaculia bacterium]|nr:hypothetical protein [Thermoanaerobaculia bacterium]